jgi:DNA-3-methyladenine glycosylase I
MGNADLVVGEDGVRRCAWGTSTAEYRAYHDGEWARPVGDNDRIFEMLCLEGFQAGLSWLTILRKRDGFREAFACFDPSVVAKFGDADIERLLNDSRIVRHRGKIGAAISNARATMALQENGDSIAALFWRHQPQAPAVPKRLRDLAPSTAESKSLSAELRRLGFSFVGPTTVYSAMQAVGVVNDHLLGCHFRAVVEENRTRFALPR